MNQAFYLKITAFDKMDHFELYTTLELVSWSDNFSQPVTKQALI
jgi:hypothetical protein